MIHLPDEQLPALLHLRMAAQAKVGVGLHEHLVVVGSVRLMARGASLAQGFMLKDNAFGLFAVTARALLFQPGHRQATRRFHDVQPVWVVAVDAIHLSFTHGVMLWEVKLRVDVEMAIEARLRIAARIHDELFSTRRDVLASRSMTRLATDTPGQIEEFPVRTSSASP
jgi:hypothetical protein